MYYLPGQQQVNPRQRVETQYLGVVHFVEDPSQQPVNPRQRVETSPSAVRTTTCTSC